MNLAPHSLVMMGLLVACDRAGPVSSPPPSIPLADAAVAVPTAPPDAQVEAEADLEVEASEQDPLSQTVRMKLFVAPGVRSTVLWGRKKLGETRPGEQVLEIVRPRSSGPLDLVIKADGFLPHHARLFTDRDDKFSIRLVRPSEASGLLGHRPVSSARAEPSATPSAGTTTPVAR